jgi:hypothetical protein
LGTGLISLRTDKCSYVANVIMDLQVTWNVYCTPSWSKRI